MKYTRRNQGVCSASTTVVIEDGVIQDVVVERGCDGNLKGVCTLLKGRPVQEAIDLLTPIRCGNRKTSCPHQISLCLAEAMEQAAQDETAGAVSGEDLTESA